MKSKLILLFFSALFAVACFEIYLRFNPPGTVYMLTRNIVQQTHSEPGPSEELPYILKANIEKPFTNLEFKTMVRTNAFHMRDDEWTLQKKPGALRMQAYGDSYIFGWGVEHEETFEEQLEDRLLVNTEVMNFGLSGSCGNQSLERLKQFGLQFKPDVVLFFTDSIPSRCLDVYEWQNGRLRWEQEKSGAFHQLRALLRKHIYVFALVEYHLGGVMDKIISMKRKEEPAFQTVPVGESDDAYLREGRSILDELHDLSKTHGFKVVILFYPMKDMTELPDDDIAWLKAVAQEFRWLFIDLHPWLVDYWMTTGNHPYFKHDDHWNRDGHQAVGCAVAYELEKNGIVPQVSGEFKTVCAAALKTSKAL